MRPRKIQCSNLYSDPNLKCLLSVITKIKYIKWRRKKTFPQRINWQCTIYSFNKCEPSWKICTWLQLLLLTSCCYQFIYIYPEFNIGPDIAISVRGKNGWSWVIDKCEKEVHSVRIECLNKCIEWFRWTIHLIQPSILEFYWFYSFTHMPDWACYVRMHSKKKLLLLLSPEGE